MLTETPHQRGASSFLPYLCELLKMELLQQTSKGQTSRVARYHSAGCLFIPHLQILFLHSLYFWFAHVSFYIRLGAYDTVCSSCPLPGNTFPQRNCDRLKSFKSINSNIVHIIQPNVCLLACITFRITKLGWPSSFPKTKYANI